MNDWQPNWSWLTPHLAVGGSFPPERAEHLARFFSVAAVVDLRVEACDDRVVLARHGLDFLHLPTDDHCAVAQPMLRSGVDFVNRHLDRGEGVLIHCQHGIGRSATLALCVLVSRGMPPLEALELAKTQRSLVSPSPAQYEAWVEWLQRWRAGRSPDWEVPHFEAFAAIAYRHLRAESG
jgi:protein-tyrosine phosphatase